MATASQSLFNMTVGADNAPASQGLLMPKLQFRFRALFLNFGVGGSTQELTKQVIDVTRPSVSFGEINIPVYNSRMYLAGRHQWQTLAINIRDDASGSVAKLIGQQMQKQVDFVEQASAASGQDYKFQTNIEILDGGNGAAAPTVLETWELYGCYLQGANYGDLNYGSSEAAQVEMTIVYDNANQTPLGTGVGSTVARTLGDVVTGAGGQVGAA